MQDEGRGRTALVTGASAGISRAFAEALAARGYALILTARRQDRLEAIAADIHGKYGVATHIVLGDLADPATPRALMDEIAGRGLVVDVLVNNAGYGLTGRFDTPSWHEHQAFLQVMVTAVCELTYRVLPGMIERRWGRIVNIASLAGHLPAPAGHTLYAASKAFLIRFSEALHAERAADGVHTTAVCPGFTYSEFHDVTGTRAQVSRMPGWMWLQAPDVARQGVAAVMRGQPVLITGRINQTIAWLARVLPQAAVRRVVGGTGKRFRKI